MTLCSVSLTSDVTLSSNKGWATTWLGPATGGTVVRTSGEGLVIWVTLHARGQVVRWLAPWPHIVTLFTWVAVLV